MSATLCRDGPQVKEPARAGVGVWMKTLEPTITIKVALPRELHRALKLACVELETSMTAQVVALATDFVRSHQNQEVAPAKVLPFRRGSPH
jgi:hypothetical protein